MTTCPSAAGSNCVGSCEAEFLAYPAGASQVQADLECISTIAIVCSSSGSLDTSACAQSLIALESCIHPTATAASAP